MKEVLQQICDVLRDEFPSGHGPFMLYDDGSGHIDPGDGGRSVSWSNLDGCVKQFRSSSIQAAKKRVVAAVLANHKRFAEHSYITRSLNNEYDDAVKALVVLEYDS